MDSSAKRVLIPRGAPNFIAGIAPQRLEILSKLDIQGKNQKDQCDSGIGDSFKSQEGSFKLQEDSYERTKTDSRTVLEDMEKMTINEEDDSLVDRHPGPCLAPESSDSTQTSRPQTSPVENILNFAQCNDVRYLLAPYRHHLLMQNEDGDTPLHVAIIHQLPQVAAFVSIAPGCLNIYNYLRQTPLHLAVITKQPSVVHCLLSGGASIDLVDRNGKTALHLACERGDMDCINVLLQPLMNSSTSEEQRIFFCNLLNTKDYNGYSALHLAASNNFYDVVGVLVNLGANVDLPDATSGKTAVHHAVENNNFQMLQYLLFNCQANVNAQRFDESTALHSALGQGLVNISACLMAAGADMSITNDEDETPLEHTTAEVREAFTKYM